MDVVSTDTVKFVSSLWTLTDEETFKFDSEVVGGAIPKEYIPAVGAGIEEAAKLVFLVDSLLLVYMLQYTTDLTMKSILLKWHSR